MATLAGLNGGGGRSGAEVLVAFTGGIPQEAYANGRPPHPTTVADWGVRNTALSPRYCISDKQAMQAAEFRLIDDISRPKVNETVSASDTYSPQHIGRFAALARLQRRAGEGNLKMRSVDFAHAYKTSGLRLESSIAAYVRIVAPSSARHQKARTLAQPSGSKRASANWARVVTFLQFLVHELLRLTVGAYVDDVFCIDANSIVQI